MDEQKETKLTEPTPEQVGAFMAVLTKALSAQVEQQNKFEAIYANNFQFEPSAWDLKVLFGQLAGVYKIQSGKQRQVLIRQETGLSD